MPTAICGLRSVSRGKLPRPVNDYFLPYGYHLDKARHCLVTCRCSVLCERYPSAARCVGSNKRMLRSGNQLASSGCRVGRRMLASRILGASPSASQLKPFRGQGQVGLPSCAARSSMASACRAGHSHHPGVACGAAAALACRGSLPAGAGRSKLARGAAFGNVDRSMYVMCVHHVDVCHVSAPALREVLRARKSALEMAEAWES